MPFRFRHNAECKLRLALQENYAIFLWLIGISRGGICGVFSGCGGKERSPITAI